MDYNLRNKVVLITGGTSGLGAAVSELCLEIGANVVANYLFDEEKTIEWAEKLNQKYKAELIIVKGDVSDKVDNENLFKTALNKFGKVDVLVNSAGIWPTAYVKEMELEAFEKTLAINLLGPFMLSKLMVNYCMGKNLKGKIINIVSQAAFHGSTSGHAHYAASKAGLVGFTISLAREVAPYGINVTAVAPGMMESPMNADVLADPKRRGGYLERIPLRRVATTREVAQTVLFLASSQADYITGATIDVTGGMLMR